ncbi:MAG: cobalamin-binding protein [Candidatus Omnitrophica bacterium CG07_land_8_20_14_0_80_42_15]|uniref:Cobalamin-binding protein n=1 Tax=Candidatus Aquitaenariimonas noxiae TaxID=1974741 RepID=A0A2J0KR22_9BACT|nr:MAG: cobalamin-binding protein [Candidatus Omnitrophica bacterium CG07_land_8_20_14_0_80_42_15]
MSDFSELKKSVFAGNITGVKKLVQDALQKNISAKEILNNGLIAGMNDVGEKFKNNQIYIPEVLIAAKAMQAGLDIIKPILVSAGVKPVAKVAIGTVKGDLHDIGKNIVSMMLKGAGFDVIDFGIDTPVEKFVLAAKDGVDVIAMSALVTTSMPSMKRTIEALYKEGLKSKVKTIIGGAPITQKFADEIGADGYTRDAASAANKIKEILNIK